MYTLCCIEGINVGSGNPGSIDFELTREVQINDANVVAKPSWYPEQHKPLIRRHHEAGYECFSAILAYIVEFGEHEKTHHLCKILEYPSGNFNVTPRVMGPTLSAALLGALLKFVTQEPFRYFHEWKSGDLLIW